MMTPSRPSDMQRAHFDMSANQQQTGSLSPTTPRNLCSDGKTTASNNHLSVPSPVDDSSCHPCYPQISLVPTISAASDVSAMSSYLDADEDGEKEQEEEDYTSCQNYEGEQLPKNTSTTSHPQSQQQTESQTTTYTCSSETKEAGETPPSPVYDFIIFLDWDDTLFPTTVINEILQNMDKNDQAMVADDQIALLSQLGQDTLSLLTDVISTYGAHNVYIVTNSLDGWIKDSLGYAACIAPIYAEIAKLLVSHHISMYSAQSLFGKACGGKLNPTQWKAMCFKEILLLMNQEAQIQQRHVLSIGDQWADHYAVKQSIVEIQEYSPIHHIIKLKIVPNLADMCNEMLYIKTCFTSIFNVIACKDSVYHAEPHRVHPVVIDYHQEELKHYCSMNMNSTTSSSPRNTATCGTDRVTSPAQPYMKSK